uniref:Expressed protein n=1 Tax=Echinococcus granulosus TaxID=6210 RepID=A0A068W6X8_ECHGR|nr:expressed protein [Echinococcus granulosus]
MLWRVQLLRIHSNKSPTPTPVLYPLHHLSLALMCVRVCFSVCLLTFVSHSLISPFSLAYNVITTRA